MKNKSVLHEKYFSLTFLMDLVPGLEIHLPGFHYGSKTFVWLLCLLALVENMGKT